MSETIKNINRAVRPSGRLRARLLVACVLLVVRMDARAQQPRVEIPTWLDPDRWCLQMQPGFLRPPVFRKIPGAKTTVVAAGTLGSEGGPRDLAAAEFRTLGVDWAGFSARAGVNADALLAQIEPEFFRDKHGSITHARLQSDKPFAALVVFAPGFGRRFEDTLGPDPLVAVPNRSTVFVFPRLAGPHEAFGETVLSLYKNSAYPASLEIFEWQPEGLRAMGTYGDD